MGIGNMLRNKDAISASGMGKTNKGPGRDEVIVEDKASRGSLRRGRGESFFPSSGSISAAGVGQGLLVLQRAGKAIIGSGEED